MKTIFDFAPSQTEIRKYAMSMPQDEYIKFFSTHTLNLHIAKMLYERGDDKYKIYINKLPEEMILEFLRTISHP